jgi:glycopeptide antibiotics resistance protein
VAKAVAVAYVIAVLALTLLPVFGADPLDPVTIRLTPFRTIRDALSAGLASSEFALVVANVAMFVPFGVLIYVLRRQSSFWYVLAVGGVLSGGIELSQLAISLAVGHEYRMADIDDVMLNVGGALIGYMASRIWRSRVSSQYDP